MKKPNIIFFLTDDQGAWALNCGTNSEIHTPNLDKLAKRGKRYDNFFCASPVCSPARASILTGEMPSCHGVLDFLSAGNTDSKNYPELVNRAGYKEDKSIEYLEHHPSYVDMLQQHGYTCAHSGKWHLGASDKPKKGFSKWFVLEGGGCDYYEPYFYENGNITQYNAYVTDVITDKAIEYVSTLLSDDKPFYMNVHYTAPHSPWNEKNHPKEYIDLYKNSTFSQVPYEPVHKNQINSCPVGDTEEKRRENLRGYYASITAMDANIGRVLDVLEKNNALENTIIIFSSDNGMNLGQHGIWGKGNGTYPPNLYDTSVKIPFIISAPCVKDKGSVDYSLQSHCDLFPTILDLCSIPFEPSKMQTGKSFYNNLTHSIPDNDNRDIFISSEYGAIRMIRTKDKKLIWDYKNNLGSFFNLTNDKNEENNLIENQEYSTEISELKQRMEVFFDSHSASAFDARNCPVVGKGQRDFCYHKKAFNEKFEYFWKNGAKRNST